jgi:recombination protein RecA
MYAEGISHTSLLVDIGSEANIIEKSGAWYSYNGQKIGQGRENAKMYLKDNPAMMAEIEEKVKAVLGINGDQAATVVESEDEAE